MTRTWVEDERRASPFVSELLEWGQVVLAKKLVRFELAAVQDDALRATDAFAVFDGDCRIAIRVRFDCSERDWTVRLSRRRNSHIEWQKLIEGWGDYYLYGWTEAGVLIDKAAIDLRRARLAGILAAQPVVRWWRYENKDKSSSFLALPIDELNRHWPRIPCPICGRYAFTLRSPDDEIRSCQSCGHTWNAGGWSVGRVLVARA